MKNPDLLNERVEETLVAKLIRRELLARQLRESIRNPLASDREIDLRVVNGIAADRAMLQSFRRGQ